MTTIKEQDVRYIFITRRAAPRPAKRPRALVTGGIALVLALTLSAGSASAQAACTGNVLWGDEVQGMLVAASNYGGVVAGREFGVVDALLGSGWMRTRSTFGGTFANWREREIQAQEGLQLCGLVDFATTWVGDNSYMNLGLGPGAAWSAQNFAASSTAFLGYAAGGIYTELRSSGSYRVGRWMAGLEVSVPLGSAISSPAVALRAGYTWGSPEREQRTPPTGPALPTPTPTPATPAPAPTQPTPAQPAPQQPAAGTRPYALDDIEAMVRNNVATARILDLARRSCVSFRMNDAADTRLRRVGADPELLAGLRQVCFSAQ